jgi:hypothetical protein
MMRCHLPLVVSLTLLPLGAHAGDKNGTCPDAVTSAVEKAYPQAKISKCKSEKEDGKVQFEVKLVTEEGKKLELDVSPEGAILQTEEVVAVADVPAAVSKAFAAKYPKAKIARAEKQTHADASVSYELAFQTDKGKKEATFTADGKFVEEE